MAKDYSGILFTGGILAGVYMLYKHLADTCQPGDSSALCGLYNSVFGAAVVQNTPTSTAPAATTPSGNTTPPTPSNPAQPTVPASTLTSPIPYTPIGRNNATNSTAPVNFIPAATLSDQLLSDARKQSGNPNLTTSSVSGWNWIYNNITDRGSEPITSSQYGLNDQITAEQYLALRQGSGIDTPGSFVIEGPAGGGHR